MLGVLVNMLAVVIGSLIGLLCRRGVPKKLTDAVMTGIGLCILCIGISGVLKGQNSLILIISTVLGVGIGTLLDLDGKVNRLGEWVGARFARGEGSGGVAQAFVTASLVFCVGAMAIIGSFQSGLTGDNTTVFTKSLLDLISSVTLTVSLGFGVVLSAVSVCVYQGLLVLLAGVLAPVFTESTIAETICVGSLMIIALGLNIMGITKIKVANFMPAMVIAPLLSWLLSLPFFSNLLA